MIDTKWVAAASLAACLAAGTAQATTTYTFDFTQTTKGWSNAIVVKSNEDPTVTVTASAGTYDDSQIATPGNARVATWSGAGLGVCGALSSDLLKCRDTNHRVDGNGTNDLALFSFGSALSVTSISFSYFDSVFIPAKYEKRNTTCKVFKGGKCKEWNFVYDLVTPEQTIVDMFDLFLAGAYASTGTVAPTVSFTGLPSVLSFGIGAAGIHDAFKIVSLTAEYVPPPAPVPLPAGGLLLLSAMGGIAAIKRRRKTA